MQTKHFKEKFKNRCRARFNSPPAGKIPGTPMGWAGAGDGNGTPELAISAFLSWNPALTAPDIAGPGV